jgi:hypothetical protein
MHAACDDRFGDWRPGISKARLVWFALAQKSHVATTPEDDPFAGYGAAEEHHFELGATAEEALGATRRTVLPEG